VPSNIKALEALPSTMPMHRGCVRLQVLRFSNCLCSLVLQAQALVRRLPCNLAALEAAESRHNGGACGRKPGF
jgi:hypothetical protein